MQLRADALLRRGRTGLPAHCPADASEHENERGREADHQCRTRGHGPTPGDSAAPARCLGNIAHAHLLEKAMARPPRNVLAMVATTPPQLQAPAAHSTPAADKIKIARAVNPKSGGRRARALSQHQFGMRAKGSYRAQRKRSRGQGALADAARRSARPGLSQTQSQWR